MEDKKWLKRKYPQLFEELDEYFDRQELSDFKKSKMKIGRLKNDVIQVQKYKKGSILQYRKSNPVNDYNHPLVYVILKCKIGFTASGYHSFNILPQDLQEQ